MKLSAVLPTSCLVGELLYLTTAAQGNNLYGCVAANVWSLQGGLAAGPVGSWLTSTGTQAQWVGPSGDLAGTSTAVEVSGLRNRPIATTAPTTGQVLSWDGLAWKPQTINGAPGTITVKSDGTTLGTQGVVNYIAGTGIVNAITVQSGEFRLQQNVDTAVVMLRSDFQSGQANRCEGVATANAYTCALNPALSTYSNGMRVFLQVGSANTGAATLNINGLGAVSLRRADGTTNLVASDLLAGQLYPIWFDGTNFRLVEIVLPARTAEYCNATATVNAFACALNPVPGAYTTGMQIFLQAGSTNTGAATLNINGLGAVSLRRADGNTNLVADDLLAGQVYPIWYDGTNFRMVETQTVSRSSQFCSTASASNAYTCSLYPGFSAYAAGLQLTMLVNTTNTGAVTLNVNGLGAVAVRRADGTTDLLAGDIETGATYPLWHDGTRFRLIETPSPVRATAATRPTCDVSRRGLLWQQFSATGVKDTLAVCAKDSTDAYAWRGLY